MSLERRIIQLEGGSNLRDIGGYETDDGRRVKWGVVYRSAAISRLTARDWEILSARRVALVCDLRSHQEREIAPTRWGGGDHTRHIGTAYDGGILFNAINDPSVGVGEMETKLYLILGDILTPLFKEFFHSLVEGGVPAIVHCTAGQDRTGIAVGLLLSTLGVPRATILQDYALSPKFRRVENEMDLEDLHRLAETNLVAGFYSDLIRRRGAEVLRPRELINQQGEPLLLDAFGMMTRKWGSIAGYMDEMIGIGESEANELRRLFLEPVDAEMEVRR